MMDTNTHGFPIVGDGVSRSAGQERTDIHFQQASFSGSSASSYISDLEKKPGLTLSTSPSRLARLHPRTWSRKMRLLAITGVVTALVALVPALAVPLALNHAHPAVPQATTKPQATGTPAAAPNPLFVHPPATSLIANGTALRIMPLGASITFGLLSSDGNGYREDLLGLLRRGGNANVTYVGSRTNGTMAENAVEGWPGLRIDQVLPKAAASVPRDRPNVVLLNAGTNDCVQDWNLDRTTLASTAAPALTASNATDVGGRMRLFVEDLLAWSPDATVVMSTLVLNREQATNARVDDANRQFRAVAADLQAQGRRVVLADMSAGVGGPNATTMADVTHPNDVGYALMANRWYVALQEAGKKGMIAAPTFVRSA